MATRLATGNYHNLSWAITADGALITLQINRKYENRILDHMVASPDQAMECVRDEITRYNAYRKRNGHVSTYDMKDGMASNESQ